MKTYYHRSTAEGTLLHAATNEVQLGTAAGSGAGTLTHTFAGGTSALAVCWTTPSNEPNSGDWPSGTYRCVLEVSVAGADISYGLRSAGAATGHFARVNDVVTIHQETVSQAESLFTGTGVKSASASWDPTAGAAGDRFECLLAGTRAASHGNQDLTVVVDATDADATNGGVSDGPWTDVLAVGGANIAATLALFVPTLSHIVQAATIAATLVTSVPSAAYRVAVAALVSGLALFAPTVVPGAVSVVGAHKPTSAALSPPTVAMAGQAVTGAHLAPGVTLSVPTAAYRVVTSTIAAGSGLNAPTARQVVVAAGIAAGSVVTSPTVSQGAQSVTGAHRASTATVNVPAVAPGPVTVTGAHRASGHTLNVPTVAPGAVTLAGANIAAASVVRVPTVTYAVAAPTIAAASALNAPSIAVGSVAVAGAHRASTVVLSAPSVAGAWDYGDVVHLTGVSIKGPYASGAASGPSASEVASRGPGLSDVGME